MNLMTPWIFLVFFLCINSVSSVNRDDIGIKVVFTQPGLSELLLVIDQSLTELAAENEPFYIEALPPIIDTDMELNITNITLLKTSHSSLAGVILPGAGLEAVMKGATANMTFNMTFKIKQGPITLRGTDFVEMNIGQTEITMLVNLTAMEDGNPLVTLNNMTIDIGTFEFLMTGDYSFLNATIGAGIQTFLETNVPVMIMAKINGLLYNLTSQLELDSIQITPGTALNLTLPNNPYTTESLTLVTDLRGFAYIPSDDIYGFYHGCESPMITPIEAKYSFSSRMVQIALSDQVANCLAETLFVSYQLNALIQTVFHKFIDAISPGPLQPGLELRLSCTLPPTITSSIANGITIDIPAELTWIRSPPVYPVSETYISLYNNLSISLGARIESGYIFVNLTSASLELDTAYVSPSMPERYLQQVNGTEWIKINSYLKAILAKLLPFLNEKLAGGFKLPDIPTERITLGLSDLKIYNGYIVLSTSFVGNDK